MRRLFTFGCSFTQYSWPTWADILGREYDYFENWGKSGAGNVYIASSVVEASLTHNFTKDDTIMIMWTNMMREDRYLDKVNKWSTPGNIYTQQTYPKDFVKNFITVRGCYVRDMTQIYLTSKLLDSIGCKYEFMSMVDLNNPDQYQKLDASSHVHEVLELYKDVVNKFKPSVHKVLFNYEWQSRLIPESGSPKYRTDSHPVPGEHLEYLDIVLPNIGISDATREWVKLVDAKARKLATPERINTFNPYIGWKIFDNAPASRL
jgi:hypothetical protein